MNALGYARSCYVLAPGSSDAAVRLGASRMAQAAAARMASTRGAFNWSLWRFMRCGRAAVCFRLVIGFWNGQIQRIVPCFKVSDRQFDGHAHLWAAVGTWLGAAADDDVWIVVGPSAESPGQPAAGQPRG